MLEQFPFRILGFHSDNGSEFINHNVEALLNKLLIEQTKSRPRHSNDNGLVESKNGAVIRKHMGFDHYRLKPCRQHQCFLPGTLQFVPELSPTVWSSAVEEDCKGKTIRTYNWYAHAVGNTAANARRSRIFKGWISPSNNWNGSREWTAMSRRDQDAGSEEETVWQLRKQESGMTAKRAAEMPGCGQRGKPKAGFPSPSTSPLEIADAFHIPRSRIPQSEK